MYMDAEERKKELMNQNRVKDGMMFKIENDPRIIGGAKGIGNFIRKYSIDEFPQFWNVLKGDMSLVGPRPEVPYYVEQFKEEVPLYMVKHQVRPGITGWAQVNGLRGDTSIKARIEHDVYYIEHWSLGFDLKILWMTLFKGKFLNDESLSGSAPGRGGRLWRRRCSSPRQPPPISETSTSHI